MKSKIKNILFIGGTLLVIGLIVYGVVTFFKSKPENNPNDRLTKIIARMENIDEYVGKITINYSDEQQNIYGNFISNIDTENARDNLKGIVNYNGTNYEFLGQRNPENGDIILNNVDGEYIKINEKIFRLKDLKYTNFRPIKDRAGEKNLEYFLVTINDRYEAKIGVSSDNVIYTLSLDLRGFLDKDKVVGVYSIEIEISDDYIPQEELIIDEENVSPSGSFFELFTTTDAIENVEEV